MKKQEHTDLGIIDAFVEVPSVGQVLCNCADALQHELEEDVQPVLTPEFSLSLRGPLDYSKALKYIKEKLELEPVSLSETVNVAGTHAASIDLFMQILSLPNCSIRVLRFQAGGTANLSNFKPNKYLKQLVIEQLDFDGISLAEVLAHSQVELLEVHDCYIKNRGDFIKKLSTPSLHLNTKQISFLDTHLQANSKITKLVCEVHDLQDLLGVVKNNSTLKELGVGFSNVRRNDDSKFFSEFEFNTSLQKLSFNVAMVEPITCIFRMNTSLQSLKLPTEPAVLHKLLVERPNAVTKLDVYLKNDYDQNSLVNFIQNTTILKSLTINVLCTSLFNSLLENTSIHDINIVDAHVTEDCAPGISNILQHRNLIGFQLLSDKIDEIVYQTIFESLLGNTSLKSFGIKLEHHMQDLEPHATFFKMTTTLERLFLGSTTVSPRILYAKVGLDLMNCLKNNLSILEASFYSSSTNYLYRLLAETNVGLYFFQNNIFF